MCSQGWEPWFCSERQLLSHFCPKRREGPFSEPMCIPPLFSTPHRGSYHLGITISKQMELGERLLMVEKYNFNWVNLTRISLLIRCVCSADRLPHNVKKCQESLVWVKNVLAIFFVDYSYIRIKQYWLGKKMGPGSIIGGRGVKSYDFLRLDLSIAM